MSDICPSLGEGKTYWQPISRGAFVTRSAAVNERGMRSFVRACIRSAGMVHITCFKFISSQITPRTSPERDAVNRHFGPANA